MVAIFIAGWFLIAVRKILLPFALSFAFAYLLNPFVRFFESRGFRRERIVTILYAAMLSALVGGGLWLASRAMEEMQETRSRLPGYQAKLKQFVSRMEKGVSRSPLSQYVDEAIQSLQSFVEGGLGLLPRMLKSFFVEVSLLALVPFITFFLLADGPKLLEVLFALCPARWVETTVALVEEIETSLGGFLRGQFIAASCVGCLSIAGLWFLGAPHPLSIGALAGLGNIIPYLGPFVGGAAAVLAAFLREPSFALVIKIIALFSVIQFLDNNFISPFVVGKIVNLHPVAILFALLAGAQLGGGWGLLFAVPAACVVKVIAEIGLSHWRRNLKTAGG